ncbi:hypothetical protein NLX83_32430 [Allokutzneria sp. A3M-2-11 16]|uniref:hypothetical protein n=1 Tax=Allokutzneria sp. A3M-2-11 16 TaxID=2962043 RepID=UPI0020B6AFF8|nr:hypothetical protein [Allokutzneria sp. A3M-2-11 16]MCP3803987.1 hypothetical protein [Allokutzneria sp. A3M-2-11 16]
MFSLVLAGIALLTACGESGPAAAACPEIAARAGIGIDIEPPLAAKVAKASLNGTDVHLDESTRAEPGDCAGKKPEDTCKATMVPTGAKNGFLDMTGLKLEPTRVSVRLTDSAGAVLVEKDIEITPKQVFPHGKPECGGAQPQAGVIVAADGTLRARP